MNGIVKKIVSIVLLFVIAGLVYAIVQSVMQPVNFNKQMEFRKTAGIQRMKDLRTLQEAYKSVYGRFAPSADSLADFYKNGQMEIVMQIGPRTTQQLSPIPRSSRRPTGASLLSRCSSSIRKARTSCSPSPARST